MKSISIRQSGFSILEVLIAVVILSIGLLGIAGMQASAMSNNHAAYSKTQATALAMDMADRIRANAGAAASYAGFDTSSSTTSDQGCISSENGCTSTQLANHDLYEWSMPIVSTESPILPGGRGIIAQNGNTITIAIYWREAKFEDIDRPACLSSQPTELDNMGCLAMSFQL